MRRAPHPFLPSGNTITKSIVLLFAVIGCLPPDDRTEPGALTLAASSSDAAVGGFSTIDGWTISWERVLTAVGDIELNDPDGSTTCTSYSETNYDRLFDFTLPGRRHIGIVYGLGVCDVEYRMRAPSFDVIVGAGASQADVAWMRVEASDEYHEFGRTALYVKGSATRDGDVKRFEWSFRRSYRVDRCESPGDAQLRGDGDLSKVTLQTGDDKGISVVVRPEELFRRSPVDEAPLVFEPYAAADDNGDGELELRELMCEQTCAQQLPSPDGWQPNRGEELSQGRAIQEGPEVPEPKTLGDLVYRFLLPRVTVVAGASECRTERRGGFGGR